ncbi:MAG: SDR family oxidoreductase [Desulfobacterales bacterium]|jgi:NAD(P)-dependent dehydrogenase (short-subunit alcohol dehydrogenase family)
MQRRVAIVTGANRGLGFEIARQLADLGITVVMGSRDPEQGAAAAESLQSDRRSVISRLLDVNQASTIQAAIGDIMDRYGRIDILVNNAGIMIDSQTTILELDLTLFQNTLETNALGALLLSQACIPHMQANNYGRIVNISSTLGSLTDIATPDSEYSVVLSPAYRLSKTLLNGLTVLLAKELQETNILVNSACPGWVRTRLGGERAPLMPAQGAETPVWLATLPDDGPRGGFFREKRPIPW